MQRLSYETDRALSSRFLRKTPNSLHFLLTVSLEADKLYFGLKKACAKDSRCVCLMTVVASRGSRCMQMMFMPLCRSTRAFLNFSLKEGETKHEQERSTQAGAGS